MLTEIKHTRTGRIRLHPLYTGDYPETVLPLQNCFSTKAFLGRIDAQQYGSDHGPLFSYSFRWSPTVELDLREENDQQLLLVPLEGRFFLRLSTTERTMLTAMHFALFRGGEYQLILPGPCRVRYLLFKADALLKHLGIDEMPTGTFNKTTAFISKLKEIIQPAARPSLPSAWLSIQLAELLLLAKESAEKGVQPGRGSRLSYVLAADAFIRENLQRNFTTQELAYTVGINECTLKRAYMDHFQVGMARRQNQLRVEHAKQLLQQTDLQVSDIALACGYSSATALRYNFLNETNTTPLNWRKNNKL